MNGQSKRTQAIAGTGKADLVARPVPPVEKHPAAVYLASLGRGSRRTMRQALDVMAGLLTAGRSNAQMLDWSALRYQHTQALRAALAERYAHASVNKMLAALRGVLRESWRLGLTDAETYHRAVDLKGVKGLALPRGRALSSGEIRALFTACAADSSPAGARDASLLALLYGAGLRRSEVVALDLGDYNPEDGALTIRGGKGRKDRIGYATNGSALALEAWLRVRGSDPGPLFGPINKGGCIQLRRMTTQAVFGMVRKRASEAGIAEFSPHDLRRSFISDLLDAGADISTVQHLAGHSSVNTTARYDRRGEAVKKRTAELLAVPFRG